MHVLSQSFFPVDYLTNYYIFGRVLLRALELLLLNTLDICLN